MAATTVSCSLSGSSSSSSCSGGRPACSECPTRCRAPKTISPRLVEVPFLRAGKRPTTNGQTGGISWSASGQSCVRRGSQFIGVSLLSLSEYSSSDTDTPSRDHESHPGGNISTISSFISGDEDSSASYHSQPSSPCFCSLFVHPAFTKRTYRGQNGRCGSFGTSFHDSRKISSFFRLVERCEGRPGWSELRGRWIRTGCLCRGLAVSSVVCYVPSDKPPETRSYASQPSGVPVLPQDPAQRVTMALDLIDGYTEIIVAMLRWVPLLLNRLPDA